MNELLETSPSLPGVPLPFSLSDVERLRLTLRGDSVVDWRRLAIGDLSGVDRLLALTGIHAGVPADMMRLLYLHRAALDYIHAHVSPEALHPEVRDPNDVRNLLLLASRPGPAQTDACTTLKVMHVIHHVAGRELLYRLPVPTNELFHRVERAVFDAIDSMKATGVQVVEFAGSRKTPDSIITKLLCRKDSLAAAVYDRLRFRVVTETLDDLLSALVHLNRNLLPFNYVVPGESRNDLIDFEGTLGADPHLSRLHELLQELGGAADRQGPVNYFSGSGFKMINFVVDMPVRVDDLIAGVPGYNATLHGCTVFLMVEFQLMDRSTSARNNSGESRHSRYKARQVVRVRERLLNEASGSS